MGLSDFQTALGRLVRSSVRDHSLNGLSLTPSEHVSLASLVRSAGFQFTVQVQRSWCERRLNDAAEHTLSILPKAEAHRLRRAWADAGGGTASMFEAEAFEFLQFIATQLPNPSHARTFCLMEQAARRATEGSRHFRPSPLLDPQRGMVKPGVYASLVDFHAEPHLVLAGLRGEGPLPPLSQDTISVLFAPGLEGFCRIATADEAAVFAKLANPASLIDLVREGHQLDTIQTLVTAGAAEYSG